MSGIPVFETVAVKEKVAGCWMWVCHACPGHEPRPAFGGGNATAIVMHLNKHHGIGPREIVPSGAKISRYTA